MTEKRKSIYLHPEVDAQIKQRGGDAQRGGNRSMVINRDLERLYVLYDRALKETPLTPAQACLIVDCLNGTMMEARSAGLLWAEIKDGIKYDGLDEKWELDGPALVEHLRSLSVLQGMALIDAAERFWNLPDAERDIGEGVRKCFNIHD